MKYISLVFGLLMLCNIGLFAEDWASDTQFQGTNSTIVITSWTACSIAATTGYREVYVGDPSSTVNVFYRLDEDTKTISTTGWWIPAGQGVCIKTNHIIYFNVAAGVAAVTLRKMILWR